MAYFTPSTHSYCKKCKASYLEDNGEEETWQCTQGYYINWITEKDKIPCKTIKNRKR